MAKSLFMGFSGMDPPSKEISFGTKANRPTFPFQIAHDRFGNENNPFRGVKEVGPGQYDHEEKTTFTKMNRPISLRGYVIGARTAERKVYREDVRAPSPTHYQQNEKKKVKPCFKPFNNSAERFRSNSNDQKPGPGSYEHDVQRNRNIQMSHSFGGRVKSVPAVQINCVNDLEIKCESCGNKPFGDFFQCRKLILCSPCYEYNWKWQEKYTRSFLTSFKKARDCSFIHEHEGTLAAIQKVNDKELRKLRQKEAYLSLYWA